jgi:hypothetical protein
VQFGAHLPLVSFGGTDPSLSQLCTYTEQAGRLGYTYLCANDHLVFDRPWLDGPLWFERRRPVNDPAITTVMFV